MKYTDKQRAEFLTAYIECALWSSGGCTDENGEELDSLEGYDVATDTHARMREECDEFIDTAARYLDEWTPEQAGHDFWLTRVGHGAGFWDRGKANGNKLTALCKDAGNRDLYVGDDGLIYQG